MWHVRTCGMSLDSNNPKLPNGNPSISTVIADAWYVARRGTDECIAKSRLPKCVRIVEVGPRDGLQNESTRVPTGIKVALVHDLMNAGLSCVEMTGFVSPKLVPQLSDAADVARAVRRKPGVLLPVLVPNKRGFDLAVAAGAKEVAVCASATERFSEKNINCSVSESLDRFREIARLAMERKIRVRGYVSCVCGCPYEGTVPPEKVARVARSLYDMGCYEVSLGDTIGVGTPSIIAHVIQSVVAAGVPITALAVHCHDTHGSALGNVLAAMLAGIAVVDSSIAGLGGCPFAPGAAGNLPTEDLVYMLREFGISCGPVNLDMLLSVGTGICEMLGRPSFAKVGHSRTLSLAARP